MILESASAAETSSFGEKLGKLLKAGDLVALAGDQVAEKTPPVKVIA